MCDDIIHAGRDGKGIYPVGTLKLPIHPNCMCWLAAVTASIDEFTSKLKGWMKGETSWPEMDDYSRGYGAALGMPARRGTVSAPGILALAAKAITSFAEQMMLALLVWLKGGKAAMDERMRESGYQPQGDI